MIQSIGDSIIWLILTRLNDRCVLQLYLKIMPGVVERLQAKHEWLSQCSRHAPAGRVCLQPQHTQKTSHKHHVHILDLCCMKGLVAVSLNRTVATSLYKPKRQPRRKTGKRVYMSGMATNEHENYDVSVSLPPSWA